MTKRTAPVRRHGADLEGALLDAAWQQIMEQGLDGLTFEGVANRARTSRPVLYRRWSTREEMAVAALKRQFEAFDFVLPDTGSLRSDILTLLDQVIANKVGIASLIAVMGVFPREHARNLAVLRDQVLSQGNPVMKKLLDQARDRGELAVDLPDRVINLPLRLLRDEILVAGSKIDIDAVTAIIDDVFLPLVRAYQNGLHKTS